MLYLYHSTCVYILPEENEGSTLRPRTIFRDYARSAKNQQVILILVNHMPYYTLRAPEFYHQNNIIVLTLTLHSSYKIQPLDRSFHGIKKNYSNECEKWLRNHPGKAITVY